MPGTAGTKHVGISDLLAAADPFIRVLAIADSLPSGAQDGSPLYHNLPRVWPSLGDLRKLIKAVKAANAEVRQAAGRQPEKEHNARK